MKYLVYECKGSGIIHWKQEKGYAKTSLSYKMCINMVS